MSIRYIKKGGQALVDRKIYKLVFLGILIFFFCFSYNGIVYAKNDLNYDTKFAEALKVIQPINVDNLDVSIGDIYSVVDTQGKITGYSMGYFVENEPYGYAIYSLDNKNIQEFVFCKGIENMYIELEKIADLDNEVDEDNLINEIVYEGGLDYVTYDEDGNKVELMNKNDYKSETKYDVGVILNSKSVYNASKNNNAAFYRDENLSGIFDILGESNEYYCIPDFGLAMITQSYISKHSPERGYVCEVVSGTACLNYLGYLYNNNIIDTYNMIYDRCGVTKKEDNSNNGTNCHDVLKKYFNDLNTGIKLNYKFNPSFDEFKKSFTNTNREPTPVIIRNHDHSVVGLSCYEINDSKYVGIWRNWYLESVDDPNRYNDDFSGVHTQYSLYSLRYFNYENSVNNSTSPFECTFFENAQSRNIKEANTEYVSGNQIKVKCYVPYGTKSVAFPTWTAANGQDDIIWHQGSVKYGTVAECTIDLNTHNKESGSYITHIYAYDINGNVLAFYGSICNNVKTSIINSKITNKRINGYTVSCELPTGTEYVKFPTWSEINGQDDLIWYQGNISGVKGSIAIDVANHGNCCGNYITHIYAYDKYNKCISTTGVSVTLLTRTSITNANVNSYSNGNINISCYAPVGTSKVYYDVFAEKAGKNGLRSYNMSVSSSTGYTVKTINKSDFNNTIGKYTIRIRAYDSKGRQIGNQVQLLTEIS